MRSKRNKDFTYFRYIRMMLRRYPKMRGERFMLICDGMSFANVSPKVI